MNPLLTRLVIRVASIRMNLYYTFASRPTCNDCGGKAAVFQIEHQVTIRNPRWIGLPLAVLAAMFTDMPTTIRCIRCTWLNERNLNA